MGDGFAFIAIILGIPILILLVDGFSFLIFYLTNTIFLYWILYLLNIFIDIFSLVYFLDLIFTNNK